MRSVLQPENLGGIIMNLNLDTILSPLMNPALNEFQAWALQNPEESLSKTMLPAIALIEGLIANEPTYLQIKRLAFGANFCCAGQVVMGEFATLEQALTSPQARGWVLLSSIRIYPPTKMSVVGTFFCCLCPIANQTVAATTQHSEAVCRSISSTAPQPIAKKTKSADGYSIA
jgi:hypothetical protein